MGWARTFVEWLKGLDDRTADLVVLALGFGLPAVGGSLAWGVSRWRKARSARADQLRSAREALLRKRQPANPNLGLWDYAAQRDKLTATAVRCMEAATEKFEDINQQFVNRAHQVGAEENPEKKRQLLRILARELEPKVKGLAQIALEMENAMLGMVDGHRALYSAPTLEKSSDAVWLVAQKKSLAGNAAGIAFGRKAVQSRRDLMAGLRGKEQSLTVIADRYLASADRMIEAMERVEDFCANELAEIVRAKLGVRWRITLLLRHGIIFV
jgi:hypothetical protein